MHAPGSEPQTWMFAQMRAALGIPKTVDILEHVYTLAIDKQPSAMESIREVERDAMRKMVPQKGLIKLMEYLQKRGVRKAICTRNFEYSFPLYLCELAGLDEMRLFLVPRSIILFRTFARGKYSFQLSQGNSDHRNQIRREFITLQNNGTWRIKAID